MVKFVAKENPSAQWFGKRLRALREQAKMSQAELADLSGVGRLSIIRYEGGKDEPGFSSIQKLAAALGVSLSEFDRPLDEESPEEG